jgi:hypothetical protein
MNLFVHALGEQMRKDKAALQRSVVPLGQYPAQLPFAICYLRFLPATR